MYGFLLGVYVAGFVMTFIGNMFLCVLGGNAKDLWKPFVYATFWFVIVFIIWPIKFVLLLNELSKMDTMINNDRR